MKREMEGPSEKKVNISLCIALHKVKGEKSGRIKLSRHGTHGWVTRAKGMKAGMLKWSRIMGEDFHA